MVVAYHHAKYPNLNKRWLLKRKKGRKPLLEVMVITPSLLPSSGFSKGRLTSGDFSTWGWSDVLHIQLGVQSGLSRPRLHSPGLEETCPRRPRHPGW